jgi:predicted transcriptional regulator
MKNASVKEIQRPAIHLLNTSRVHQMDYKDEESAARASALRKRLAERGLTIAEFRRRSGLTRNVVYALSKGKKPSDEQQSKISIVLGER